MRLLFILASIFIATPAVATPAWFMVTPATSNPTAVQMADAASIRNVGRFFEIWTHLFYKEPVNGMKSYMMQYEVDCERRMTREKRFIDYDENMKVLGSGENSQTVDGNFRSMAPSTIGDLIVTFTCSTANERKANFPSIDSAADYRQVADFFLQPGELVRETTS